MATFTSICFILSLDAIMGMIDDLTFSTTFEAGKVSSLYPGQMVFNMLILPLFLWSYHADSFIIFIHE
jgi:hypothetical protein